MSGTWQDRLVKERDELAMKIEKLEKFKESNAFHDIAPADRVLLIDQYEAMSFYRRVLIKRIKRLK